MAKISSFDVMKAMSQRNMDIRLSTLDNVIEVRKVKTGTNITIGFYGDVVGAIAANKFCGGLLLCNKEQFDSVRKELEAAQAPASGDGK